MIAEVLPLHERAVWLLSGASTPEEELLLSSALYDHGLDLWGLKRHEEARTAIERSLAIVERIRGEGYWSTDTARASLGDLLVDMGRALEAVPLLERVVRAEDARGHTVSRLVAHRSLGRARLAAGQHAAAAESLRVAIGLEREWAKGESSPGLEQMLALLREVENSSR